MNNIQIENCSIDDLKSIITEIVKNSIKQPEPAQTDTELITRKQTAKRLGISLVTLNYYTKKGIIIAYRIGSRVRYKKDEVDNALQQVKSIKYKKS